MVCRTYLRSIAMHGMICALLQFTRLSQYEIVYQFEACIKMSQIKGCTKCNMMKSVSLFRKNSSRKDGLQAYCVDCNKKASKLYLEKNREKLRRKQYKINMQKYWPGLSRNEAHKEYIKITKIQRNKCAICEKNSGVRRLHIDHDHETGKVRGLLCGKCNRALGYLNDDKELLRKAISYLEK
jgi:hypothetical protein